MKKNILIVVLAIVTFISLLYGRTQQMAAAKAQLAAERNLIELEKQRALADANAKEAMLQSQLARVEADNARRAEADCKGKRK